MNFCIEPSVRSTSVPAKESAFANGQAQPKYVAYREKYRRQRQKSKSNVNTSRRSKSVCLSKRGQAQPIPEHTPVRSSS